MRKLNKLSDYLKLPNNLTYDHVKKLELGSKEKEEKTLEITHTTPYKCVCRTTEPKNVQHTHKIDGDDRKSTELSY